MIFEQLYLDCLSQASYLVASDGHALIVDPRRDVEIYIEAATRLGVTIEHVVATHVHADFVAGLGELAARTGATVWMGARFDGQLPCEKLADGQELELGHVVVRALETPGHTPESLCLLVDDREEPDSPVRLLSGDTVFLGDVGRPDLVGARGQNAETMAGMLFDSLRNRILPLDDSTEVWPGHGAGSACGKNLSHDSSSTIGAQRVLNWAFQESERDEFIRQLCTNLAPPPAYFAHAAALNRRGPRLAGERPPLRELADIECSVAAENGAVLLDVRSASLYGECHVPDSLNITLAGRFAEWCGKLIRPGQRVVIVAADEAGAQEAFVRLGRVGLEEVIGWRRPDAPVSSAVLRQQDVDELRRDLDAAAVQVVDVRGPGEFDGGHVPGARLAPLERLPTEPGLLDGLDPARPTAVVCATGNRSSTAAFFLHRQGFRDVRNVAGGTAAWRAAGFAVEN